MATNAPIDWLGTGLEEVEDEELPDPEPLDEEVSVLRYLSAIEICVNMTLTLPYQSRKYQQSRQERPAKGW